MKNTAILNNQLINQIQISLMQDRKRLATPSDIIAETAKETISLSSYQNTFRYFTQNRNQILFLFCTNNAFRLDIRKTFRSDQFKRINLILQKMSPGQTRYSQFPTSIWLNCQTDKVINYLIQQLIHQ